MTDQPFTLRIRLGSNEIELSGSRDDVLGALDDLPKIVNKVFKAFNVTPTTAAVEEETAREVDFPSISMDPSLSCPEAIQRLLSTEWGRRAPRKLGEILEAMRLNAIHYPVGTVKGRLTDLTKKGVLRRIKGKGGYGYLLAK